MKKSAAETHEMFSCTYGKAALSEGISRKWFQHFKNGDFQVENWHSGGRKNYKIGGGLT